MDLIPLSAYTAYAQGVAPPMLYSYSKPNNLTDTCMKLLKFLDREVTEPYSQVIIIAIISGMANSLLLSIINHATAALANQEDLTQYFLLYLVAFGLFIYGQWYAFEKAILIIEGAVFKAKNRLTRKVQQLELTFIEKVGNKALYHRLTQSDHFISQSIPVMVASIQTLVLTVFSLAYLCYISPLSFLFTIVALGLGALYFIVQSRFIKTGLHHIKRQENIHFSLVDHLIANFKAIKINQAKGETLLQRIETVSTDAHNTLTSVRKKESHLWSFGRLFIYALLPIIVFIIPSFSQGHADNIFQITATLLFLIGPTSLLVSTAPLVSRLNAAIDDLFLLEQEMDSAIINTQLAISSECCFVDFQRIQLNQLYFKYPTSNEHSGAIGPLTQTIHQGELLFIVGANGSGKSTLLKLLTGLYYPSSGQIQIDQTALEKAHYAAYRHLFSTFFVDSPLGEPCTDAIAENHKKLDYWLKKMKLNHIMMNKNDDLGFSHLSRGQQTRLAFVAMMLEDKPILVIDDLTAHQDSAFCQYFYETLLPEIKHMGKTVIAVTHDERYFHKADQVWQMDNGIIKSA